MTAKVDDRIFRELFDIAVDAMVVTDFDGRIVTANAAAARLFGYGEGELHGMMVEELMPARFRPPHRNHCSDYAGSPRRRAMGMASELYGLRRDGAEFAADISLSPAGTGFVLATVHDISQRRRSEAALKESEAALKEAQHLARIGHWKWKLSAERPTWSEEVFLMLGRDPALPAASYEEVRQYFVPESWARLSAAVQRAIQDGVHYEVDVEVQRPDGSRRWVLARGEPVRDAAGAVVELRGMMQDITERKQAEVALHALRAEMDQLLTLHVAGQTAAAIAHELNQPLNAVASYTEAALRLLRAGNPKPERLVHALEHNATQAQRAGQVMRELLEFLHKGETPTEALDINDAVRRALAIVESSGFGGFDAVVDLTPGLPPVLANRVQVEKVLVNLMRNGVEAMRGAGVNPQSITISIRTAAEENMAQVTVRDIGPGLDDETARRVFEPFFTTKPKGIGMGLAICRALVETHGGRLWFDVEPGEGAAFHFTLPFAQ